MLLFKDLSESDQKLLEEIMRKDANSLTIQDKAVLAARRDYITKEDYKRVMGIKDVDLAKDKKEKAEKAAKAKKTTKK